MDAHTLMPLIAPQTGMTFPRRHPTYPAPTGTHPAFALLGLWLCRRGLGECFISYLSFKTD